MISEVDEEPRIGDILYRVVEYLTTQEYEWEVAFPTRNPRPNNPTSIFCACHTGAKVSGRTACWRPKVTTVCFEMPTSQSPSSRWSGFCRPSGMIPTSCWVRELRAGSSRIDEPACSHLMMRVINILVNLLAVSGLVDTRSGFKCYRSKTAQDLFQYQTMERFSFDVELLYLGIEKG